MCSLEDMIRGQNKQHTFISRLNVLFSKQRKIRTFNAVINTEQKYHVWNNEITSLLLFGELFTFHSLSTDE